MKQLVGLAIVLALATPVAAQDTGLEDLQSLLDAPVNAASQYLQTAREAPAAVTVVSAQEISDYGYRTLGEVLQQVRGFYLNDDLETEYVGTRGFGRPGDYNTRVMILIDGQAQNEAASGYIFLDQRLTLNMDLVERIEVVRGPGSTLHGSGAMLAVVNVVTKEITSSTRPSVSALRGQSGSGELGARIQRDYKSGLRLTGWGRAGHRPGQDLYFSSMDDPSTNNGIAEGRDWKDFRNLGLQVAYKGFRGVLKNMSYDHGSPASEYSQTFNSDTTSTAYDGSRAELSFTTPLSPAVQLHLVGSANYYVRRQVVPLEFGGNQYVTSDRGASEWYRAEAQLRIDPAPAHRLFVGAQFKTAAMDYDLYVGGRQFNDTNLSFLSVSVYAQDEYRISKKLAATVGLRYDHYSRSRGAMAPRIALVYNTSRKSTLKFLYGSAFRAPDMEEIYSSSDQLNLIPNPNLASEYIYTTEGIWEHEWSRGLVSTVSLYDYRMRGLIELSANDEVAAMQYQNTGKANARGIELGISARSGSTRMFSSAAFQHARDGASDVVLWSSPAFIGKAGVSFSAGSLFRAGVQLRGESSRMTARNAYTDPFAVMDVTLNSKPVFGLIEVGLRVRNVLDCRYQLPGSPSHAQPSLTQAGRTVSVQVSYGL